MSIFATSTNDKCIFEFLKMFKSVFELLKKFKGYFISF